ncbi:unnamed protein product [Cuscuta campestris]|uniref:Enolpyruvate transferase domain-containing protein n=1 Tax=Cuscuta campestris TaxID=132261 RepID=A0A484N0K0_9ASTE|nr:unnamed protein product [Cuscuta campestris]
MAQASTAMIQSLRFNPKNLSTPQTLLPSPSLLPGSNGWCNSAVSVKFLERSNNKGSIFTATRSPVRASVATAEMLPKAPEEIVLQPITEISGTVKLPGSKSVSNRILLLAALSQGTTVVENLLNSDDVRYMLGALRTLGLRVEEDGSIQQATVEGSGGLFPASNETKDEIQLFLGNAGTAMRPLTAAVVAAGGNARYVLDGVPRMRERPIGDLVLGLKQLGADVDCFLGTNCPPVRVNGKGGLPGGKVRLTLYLEFGKC